MTEPYSLSNRLHDPDPLATLELLLENKGRNEYFPQSVSKAVLAHLDEDGVLAWQDVCDGEEVVRAHFARQVALLGPTAPKVRSSRPKLTWCFQNAYRQAHPLDFFSVERFARLRFLISRSLRHSFWVFAAVRHPPAHTQPNTKKTDPPRGRCGNGSLSGSSRGALCPRGRRRTRGRPRRSPSRHPGHCSQQRMRIPVVCPVIESRGTFYLPLFPSAA